jgi:hypothetical protein
MCEFLDRKTTTIGEAQSVFRIEQLVYQSSNYAEAGLAKDIVRVV